MSSVNKVILIGNLGADPEVRHLPAGGVVCNLRIATTEKWKDKLSGEPTEATEWHRIVLYRRLGEIAGEYLKKGSSVYIEGRLRTRKWQGRDGQERNTTEIEGTEMQMLGSRAPAPREDTYHESSSPITAGGTDTPVDFDDIPF